MEIVNNGLLCFDQLIEKSACSFDNTDTEEVARKSFDASNIAQITVFYDCICCYMNINFKDRFGPLVPMYSMNLTRNT